MHEIWKPSVTVAAIVTGDGEFASRYLLVEEEARDGLRLNQPAGHLDPGESLVAAVIRETMEETARVFAPTGLLGVYLSCSPANARNEVEREVTYLRFAFVGHVGEADHQRALDDGIVRTLWMTLAEIRASVERHRSPLVLQCAEDHARGKASTPLDVLFTHSTALEARDPSSRPSPADAGEGARFPLPITGLG